MPNNCVKFIHYPFIRSWPELQKIKKISDPSKKKTNSNLPPKASSDDPSTPLSRFQFGNRLSSLCDHHCIKRERERSEYNFQLVQAWPGKDQSRRTCCVEASVFPSGLNAAAIVDLGGGTSGQYCADRCRNDSASALKHEQRNSEHEASSPQRELKSSAITMK
jgi:hypothetical protein